jgi:mannitol/fructose-specific phosphotransferase system IIA component (Ntr-type)
VFVKTLLAAVALIDMVAVIAFAAVESFLKSRGTGLGVGSFAEALSAAATEFALAGAIALACSLVAIGLLRVLVGPAFLGPLMVAVILGSWGLARGLGTSSILACTLAGVALSNFKRDTARAADGYLHPFGNVLFAGFFTFAGMRLNFALVIPAAALVALFFAGRLAGKSLSAFAAMTIARMTSSVRKYLGIALLPHGGVAVGLILLVEENEALASMHDTVAAVGLAALAINQLVGPSATRFALQHAGETGLDRPRLLDFLSEQHIVVDLAGKSKEDLIRQLSDRLYATSEMPIEKGQFIEEVLEREAEEPTTLGEGFMIPHTTLREGEEVRGVLGLSAEGLDLDAPDGRLVHAIVLLATPIADRNRHLEILAAFASAITRDPNLREQLYSARSAAHAYQVLHADDAKDFNYFLEDTMAPSHAKP